MERVLVVPGPVKSRRLVALACVLCAPAALADDPVPFDETPILSPVMPVEVRDLPAVTEDGLPSATALKLSLPVGAVKPRKYQKGAKAGGVAARNVAGASRSGALLGSGPVAFDVTGPAPQNLSSGATLNLNLPDAAVKAIASASVGKEDGAPSFWHKDSARITADVAGPLGTALNVAGENRLELTYRAPESVGSSDTDAHIVRTESQSGSLSLSVPLKPLHLTAGGSSASHRTQEGSPGDEDSFAQSAVRTADHSAFVNAAWQVSPDLKVEGGTAARVSSISWQNAHASTYRSVNPHVQVDVKPWQDATVTAKVEQVVAPYDAAAFARYSKADKTADASGFQPDHAWQIQTKVEQQVGPAKVSATYTAARQGTVTEFADINGAQAPATTPLLNRDSVAVAVKLPLETVGLPGTDLSSEARWQSSRVVDPVTAEARAASGEPEQTVSLRLSHRLPAHNISLGLTGDFTSERTSYQVSELSKTSATGALGAFVTYRPGAFEVDLHVNGLYGAKTRDSYYEGMRGSSKVGRTSVQDHSGPAVKLSLKKPL